MRTTAMLQRISTSVVFCLALGLVPPVATAEDSASKAARTIGDIFGKKDKEKKKKPAEAAPAQPESTEKTLEEAQRDDRVKGAAAGAAIGATAGAIVNEDDRKKGAIVGGVAGGVVGLAVGDQMAKKRGDYAARYSEVDQAIAVATQKIQLLQTDTTRIERRITLREAQANAAKERAAASKTATAAHKQALAEVEADLKANDTASQDAMVAIKVLEDEIKTITPQAKKDAELATRKTQLETKRSELLAVLQKINDADTALVAQRNALGGAARS
jgi:hypothetical protein